MSISQMRAILREKYAGSKKFDAMGDGQIRAIYMRLLNSGQLKGYVGTHA